MKRKARLERESQPVMPPRLGMLNDVVGRRVMAQQGGAVRKGTVYHTPNRRLSPWRRILPPTGIDPHLISDGVEVLEYDGRSPANRLR